MPDLGSERIFIILPLILMAGSKTHAVRKAADWKARDMVSACCVEPQHLQGEKCLKCRREGVIRRTFACASTKRYPKRNEQTRGMVGGGRDAWVRGIRPPLWQAWTMRASYLSQDRCELQFAVKELGRRMQQPKTKNMQALKRLVRFPKGSPRCLVVYNRQTEQDLALTEVLCRCS